MNKKITLYLSFGTIIIMLIFPILINLVLVFPLFADTFDKTGDYPVWVPTLATFWGAVIGGVMAGFLTIYSVNKTIQSSFQALKISSEQQWKLHERELEIANAKEMLKELYHPAQVLGYEFYMTYGAYSFNMLSSKEQNQYILLLREKSLYMNRELYLKFSLLQEVHRACDFEEADKTFSSIIDLINDMSWELRKVIGLPDRSVPETEKNKPWVFIEN